MMPLSSLSEEQRWIVYFQQRHGFPPSQRQVECARAIARQEGWLALRK